MTAIHAILECLLVDLNAFLIFFNKESVFTPRGAYLGLFERRQLCYADLCIFIRLKCELFVRNPGVFMRALCHIYPVQ